MLLVGGGRLAGEIRRRIDQRPDFGYAIVGAIAEGESPVPQGIPSLGSLEEVGEICRTHEITRVFIALPESRRHLTVEVLRACENLPIEFEIVPDLFSQIGERVRLTDMDGIPLLGVKAFPLQAWGRFVKRAFDIVLSLLLLILLIPLFSILALGIRLESRGPVFYRQRRIGRDGRVFMIAKFRSMVTGAERQTGPVWASDGDPRQTRVGSFLRRTSLDELPQLWNVLKGEMSLVGPRPERPHFAERFQKVVPRYYDRHRVKSGMTGWAQVHGLRGNTSIEERTRYDVFYVENWSLLFDVKILLLTAKHVAQHALQPHPR